MPARSNFLNCDEGTDTRISPTQHPGGALVQADLFYAIGEIVATSLNWIARGNRPYLENASSCVVVTCGDGKRTAIAAAVCVMRAGYRITRDPHSRRKGDAGQQDAPSGALLLPLPVSS